ncbi:MULTISPECIES: ATP-binding protein [Niastella]|uniref:histidine kinase n=1 Tax=Niastella soli TaxID=2821487 RepID=A0ABS3YYG4_9BACT|nr:ATP-binding protein [Niastella soli]MBO9202964.1 response regulator [Niastella soli]
MKEELKTTDIEHYPFLAGGGEMGAIMRAKDWAETPVGPVELWPQSLKSTVRNILNSKFAMWLWWGPELVQFYNDAYRPSLGKTGEKHPHALGQPGRETWGEIWPIIKPQIDQVMETGEATWNVNHSVPIYRNNILEEVYWTYSYSPVYDDNDMIGGVLVTVTETSQQVINERQLLLLKELAAKTLHARTAKGACILAMEALDTNRKDITFSLIYLVDETNKSIERVAYTGLTGNENLARKSYKLKDSVWPFATVMETGKHAIVENAASTHKSVVLPLLVAGHSKPRGFLIIGLNPMRLYDENYCSFTELITNHIASAIANAEVYDLERKKAESLAAIDRAKTIFFSNVSHELRTPLTLMLGPLQELMNDKQASPYRDIINMVYRNGIRLQKLVNALLDFSRIEAGRSEATFFPTHLAYFTMELASNFRSAIEKAGIKFTVVVPPTNEKIFVDPGMWEKIVFNLISNAFKFTFEGEIRVEVKEDTHHAFLIVSDTGIGIAAQNLDSIFTRFKRVEGSRSRSIEGSGIGLSLVHELVKLHGGSVEVQSQLNQGTTFTVSIPKGNRHLPADQIQQVAAESRLADFEAYVQEAEQWVADFETLSEQATAPDNADIERKPRIVVTDDNTDMRSYIHRLLSARFEVVCVPDAKSALQAIYKAPTDLLITDFMMPGMDGFELLKKLKSNPDTARVPVILLSARADEQTRLACIEAGVDDYLVKPFNANELLARASSIISSHHTSRETERRLYELFMQAPASIAVLRGPDHVFELSNPIYYQVIGKERSILGKPIREALPEIVDQGFVEILDEVYRTGKPFYGNEVLARLDQEGSGILKDVYFNFVYQPIHNNKNEVEGILVHAVDVTKQVKAKNRLMESEAKYKMLSENLEKLVKERTRELERSNEDLQQFAHVASHDLKEPVRKIKVFSNLLETQFGNSLPPAGKSYLQKVHSCADRMKAMIEGVLQYSSISNHISVTSAPVDLNEVLKGVEKELELLLQEKHGEIQVSPIPMVEGIDILLYQLFYNLINNSLKFSKANIPPLIEISSTSHPEKNTVTLHIADNGIGFGSQNTEMIFNPFTRLHAKDEYEGTGLGLALCKKIVERHGGKITAVSKQGHGSVFHITLPLVQNNKNI